MAPNVTPNFSKPVHTVAKGDTLSGISKKYGHKHWKDVWDAKENKAIASKRKQPEAIQPGDTLVIPYTAKEISAMSQLAVEYQEAVMWENDLIVELDDRKKRYERTVKGLESTIKSSVKLHKALVNELKKAASGAKKWGQGVDVAATVINITRGLTKLTAKGYKAMAMEGDELIKANKEMQKSALKFAYGPLKKPVAKGVGGHLSDANNNYNMAGAAVGIVLESYVKMTSPSFWGWTYVRLKEGDSWSDAVTYDFQQDCANKIAGLERDQAGMVRKLKIRIGQHKKLIASAAKERAAAVKRKQEANVHLTYMEKSIAN